MTNATPTPEIPIWKPTAAEVRVIMAAAALETNQPATRIALEPGARFNLDNPKRGVSINIAQISDDTDWNDTDLDDFCTWQEFRKGVELTADGRAIVDFYIYSKRERELLSNVTVYYNAGRITRIEGVGIRDHILPA